jgi:DNA primase
MSGRIPQKFIDELLARVDIVDLIDGYVPLKKKGKEYLACCPFHNEKTPSFTVSPVKQFYHCFGCGAHGTALGFLMSYDHLGYVEAIEVLAQKLGLTIPREGAVKPPVDYPGDLELLAAAAEFYRQALRTHTHAIEYLRRRGLTGTVAARYNLGYAPEAWDSLIRHLRTRASMDSLVRAGLVIKTVEGRHYDRFRNRIMFPIRDIQGRVIGFGGRVLDDSTPKYLNSPETSLFHKSRALYGWYEARKARQKSDNFVVAEGYMDVVALAQHGIMNTVATLGTATTRDHIRQLYRTVSEIVFCFDGDRAGRAAAWRAVGNLLPEFRDGLQARFMFLPEGEDPDSLIRKEGQTGWSQQIAKALPLDEYVLIHLQAEQELHSAAGRAQFITQAKPLLQALAEGVFKERLLIELGKLAGVSLHKLLRSQDKAYNPYRGVSNGVPMIHRSLVRMAIALLLQQPGLAQGTGELETLKALTLPGIPLLINIIETCQANPNITSASLLERFRHSENYEHLLKLMEWKPPDTRNEPLSLLFQETMARLVSRRHEQRAEQLLQKARTEVLNENEKNELQRLRWGNTDTGQVRPRTVTSPKWS